MQGKRSQVLLAVLLIGLAMLAAWAILRSGGDSAEVLQMADDEVAPTTEPTVEPTPLPLATTEPVAEPTAVPTPTPLAVPDPTPEFGPTGRPSDAGEVLVLTAKPSVRRPDVYDAPNGKRVEVSYTYLDGRIDPVYDHFTNPTYFGNPLAMRVLQGERGDDWAKVMIPTRPQREGWVKTSDFDWSASDYYVQVNVSSNTVTVWRGDAVIVDSTAVVTGDIGRETPLASTYVDEIMPGPSSAYGPWLLSLGLFSDAINTFGAAGGLPKIALHGTNRPDLLGQYASNGCIRLPNEVITMLAEEVPVGTRVDLVNSDA